MRRYLQPALIPVVLGPLLGALAAATVIETSPAILGWLFGIGMGLMGGAFIAAVTSGDSIIGGPSADRGRTVRSQAPWLDPTRTKDESDQ